MAKRTTKIDTTAAVKEDQAQRFQAEEEQTEVEKPYARVNIYVPDKLIYQDFKVYAASLGMSVSDCLYTMMEKAVRNHPAEIEQERRAAAAKALKRKQL